MVLALLTTVRKSRGYLSPFFISLLFGLFANFTHAELIRVDFPVNNDPNCKFGNYFLAPYNATNASRLKDATKKWNGRCSGGYIQGSGTLIVTYADQSRSIFTTSANFVDGIEQGPGSNTHESSNKKTVFLGNFVNGSEERGTETVKYLNVDHTEVYEGTFFEGKRSGIGMLLTKASETWKYSGQFKNGLPNGTGTWEGIAGPNAGFIWTGPIMNGKRNGTGRYRRPYSDGSGFEYGSMQFANNEYVSSTEDPTPEITAPGITLDQLEQIQRTYPIFPPKITPFKCFTVDYLTTCQ